MEPGVHQVLHGSLQGCVLVLRASTAPVPTGKEGRQHMGAVISTGSPRVLVLCWAYCFYELISFLCVCVGKVALFVFILTLLKNKLQSATNLAFPSCWLGADVFQDKDLKLEVVQEKRLSRWESDFLLECP